MKKNSLSMAVVAGVAGVAGLAGMANAVNVNPDGLGQVLLYPYYTVNGGNTTLISVVNTTERDKAVKVRFLESLNSAEVLDFNLYLSEFDVWTAAVAFTPNGAILTTDDNSCTVPNAVGKNGGTEFVPYEFQSNNPDVVGQEGVVIAGGNEAAISAAERMRQGHIEIIEMGDLFDAGGFIPASWTTHQANDLEPLNCAALEAAWSTGGRWITQNGSAVNAPSGGLFGGAAIVDVAFGRALTYNAEAIAGFYSPAGLVDPATDAPGTADLHSPPGDIQPDLRRARTEADGSAIARIFEPSGVVVSATFSGAQSGVNAVSAAIMSRFVYNEFNLDESLSASSEWVITFPTKRPHTYGRSGLDVRPFSDNVNADTEAPGNTPFDLNGLCERYGFTFWDREESPGTVSVGPIISPPPPQGAPNVPQLCWESNVIAFNQTLGVNTPTTILGAQPTQGAHGLTLAASRLASGPFGWARIEFDNPLTPNFQNYLVSQDVNPVAVVGLPVIGFWAADYSNSAVEAGVRANFSQIHKHRLGRDGYLLDATPVPAFGSALPTGLRSWTLQGVGVGSN
jgi:hypothetical protein